MNETVIVRKAVSHFLPQILAPMIVISMIDNDLDKKAATQLVQQGIVW